MPYICTRYVAEGGAVLIKIEFANRNDCEKIYHHITKHIENGNYEVVFRVSVKKTSKKQLYLSFGQDEVTFQYVVKPMLSRVFADYITSKFELKWLNTVLENSFYYKDEEEKNAIISLFYLITEGKRADLPNTKNIPSRKTVIENAVKTLLEDSFKKEMSFSFDSFLKFRLKEYREYIATYIEIAIDEYKLEQDYQSFVENLRSVLERKKPLVNALHIVYTSKAVFYDEHFQLISEEKIKAEVNQSGFGFNQTVIEPTLLQPLLMFAPKEITVYAEHEQTDLLYTLKNIFQERLTIRSLAELPDVTNSI